MKTKSFKRVLSLLLSAVLVLGCAPMGIFASAANGDWVAVNNSSVTYEPVTIYYETTLTASSSTRYLISLGNDTSTRIMANSASNGNMTGTVVTQYKARTASEYCDANGNTIFYTDNKGTTKYTVPNNPTSSADISQGIFIVDETNSAYTNNELTWNNNKLQFVNGKQYVRRNSGNTSLRVSTDNSTNEWTFSNNRFSNSDSGTNYYLTCRDNAIKMYSSTSSNPTYYTTVRAYQKRTVYKKVETGGSTGYYMYNGQGSYTVYQGSEFNEALIRNSVSVLYKPTENSTDISTLTINDSRITMSWNRTVNTAQLGTYTATVYADGTAIGTITVNVVENASLLDGQADPSTSNIRNQFPGVASDDGKIVTDKTVRYHDDEFGVFTDYDVDEFSVVLSALGQSYPEVETEEVVTSEKVHPDVVFVIDESGSMRIYNVADSNTVCRGEGTVTALNSAIKSLYEADPETRIGIVSYGHDYNDLGIYLPLDKYTLPEGQTDYILWGGVNTVSVSQSSSNPYSGLTPIATMSNSANSYFYPDSKQVSTTNDSTKLRYRYDTSNRLRVYNAGSTNYSSSNTLSSGNSQTLGGYVFYRNNNTVYIYDAEEVANNTNTVYSYPVRTKSASQSVTLSRSNTVANDSNGIGLHSGVTVTTIATVNGVTYKGYAYGSSDTRISRVYIFRDDQPGYIGFLQWDNSNTDYRTYTDNNITISLSAQNSRDVNYSTYTYSNQTGTPTFTKETQAYVASTNYLINSSGKVVRPSVYQFNTGMGTFTQAGLQAGENMFKEFAGDDLTHRVPAVVLITDGIPTIGDSDTDDPLLHCEIGTTVGNGQQTGNSVTSDTLCNLGLYTIKTGLKVKENVDDFYREHGSPSSALYYTIGPGVDYPIGRLILNPNAESLAECRNNNNALGNEGGIGVPSELYRKIVNEYGEAGLDYVDFVDWSLTGDLSTDELNEGFLEIVNRLTTISRPITSVHTEESSISALEGNASMVFTDKLGDGMEMDGAPVAVYNNITYAPTGTETKTERMTVNGVQQNVTVNIYTYNYSVTEPSTGKKYNMNNMLAEQYIYADGTQEIKWFIPAELVPIIYHDTSTTPDTYKYTDPIRLVYKVGVGDVTVADTYYTNSTDDPATAEFTPTVGNPYYFNNEEGDDGKMHSTIKPDYGTETPKTDNVTDTLDDSRDSSIDEDTGKVTEVLGNNGMITLRFTSLDVKKIWADDHDAAKLRPSGITVRVYRNGEPYNDYVIPANECTVTVDENGNDVWSAEIGGLPDNDSFEYTVEEVTLTDYNATYHTELNSDTREITNTIIHGQLSYELYLVDEQGTPIDYNGEEVSFTDRTVVSDLVTVKAYIHNTEVIDRDELEELLPPGYFLFNPDSSFTEKYEGNTSSSGSSATISDTTNTTKVFYPTGATTGSSGKVNISDYSDVKVAFAVYKIDIKPIVVVADYGKPIVTYPLEKDYRGFKVNGITAEAPSKGLETSPSVKLNNGMAVLSTNVTPELPAGDLTAQIGVTESLWFYPGIEDTSAIASMPELRYHFVNGRIEKFEKGASVSTTIAESIEDGKFVTDVIDDVKYAFYRNGDTIYAIKNPIITEGTGTGTTTVTEFVKVTPKTSGWVLDEGDYYFTSSDFKLMVTGSSASGGGIPGSSDYTVSNDVLSTTQDGVITVKKANTTNGTYYLTNSKGQYLSVNSDGKTGADYKTSPTELKLAYSSGYLVITNSASTLHLNRYGGTDTDTTYGAWNGTYDKGSWLVCYKKTTRTVDPSAPETPDTPETPETYYAKTGENSSTVTVSSLTTSYKDVFTVDGVTFQARRNNSSSNIRIAIAGNEITSGSTTNSTRLTSSNKTFVYNYTVNDALDENGDPFVIKLTFEWVSNTSVKASYELYEVREKPTTPSTPTTPTTQVQYQQLTGERVQLTSNYVVLGNKLDTSDSGDETGANAKSLVEIGTLPDGTKLYGLHNYMSSWSSRHVYIYDDSVSTSPANFVLKIEEEQSGSFKHTLKDCYDENGNPIEITVYVSKDAATGTNSRYVWVEYDGYETVTVDVPVGPSEDVLQMRPSLDSVTYTPLRYMSSIDRVYFYAYKGDFGNTDSAEGRLYSTITYIPATTVYYEDNFGGIDENGGIDEKGGIYIQYSGDWYTVNDDGSKTYGVSAKEADAQETQDRGEVGDGHVPYGYDSSYDGDFLFSDGTAASVQGSVTGSGASQKYDATATFEFTGTGFDLISRTDLDCGLINILVYQRVYNEETSEYEFEFFESVPVINKGTGTLYQIPVISYTGVPYNTYKVVINVSGPVAFLGITGCTFYLDAIRVYDPMGKKSSDNGDFDEAYSAYHTDKEANAFVASIRDFIIQIGNIGIEEDYGAVYVDTVNNNYEKGGPVIGNIKAKEYTSEQLRWRELSEDDLNSFELVGPNEEVYLSPGKGVGFIIETNVIPESIQLEMKIPMPASTEAESTLSVVTYGDSTSQKNFSIKSSSEMFYDITDAVKLTNVNGVYRATVVLTNGLPSYQSDDSSNENEIVSITNLKMTYAEGLKVKSFSPDIVGASAYDYSYPPEPGTREYAREAEMAALANCNVAVASLKASGETYKQVFDTVYVQCKASTPNYDIVNAEISDSVVDGEYADITFNTASFVDEVELVDENGNPVALTDVKAVTDESKRYSDDYQNFKTWTAKARILADGGEHSYTVKALNGEGVTETKSLTVLPAEIASVTVSKAPAKTDYIFGETIDPAGIELTARYTDDSEKIITEGIALSAEKADKSGTMAVTAGYNDLTASFNINVTPVIERVYVSKMPAKTSYKFGTDIDASGLEITAKYNDGTEKVISDYTVKSGKADKEGNMNITVGYGNFETEFTVKVKKTFWQKLIDFFRSIVDFVLGFFRKLF